MQLGLDGMRRSELLSALRNGGMNTLLSLFIVHFQCFHIVLLANEPFVSFNFRGATILRKVSNATMGGSENKGRSTLMICIY